MDAVAPSLEPEVLRELRAAIAEGASPAPEAVLPGLESAGLLEEAFELLRTAERDAPAAGSIGDLRRHLAPLARRSQQRRSALWQMDSRRTLIRMRYQKDGPALGFDDGDIRQLFLHAFRLEGLLLALDLGRRPRVLLGPGLPLPPGVGGRAELLDAVLRDTPPEAPQVLMERMNHRLPRGLRVLRWEALPPYAAPVGDLALLSRWRWEVRPADRAAVAARLAVFLAADSWPWARGGSKADEPLDLRPVVAEAEWDGGVLCFATRMGPLQALNPVKALMAIIPLERPSFDGLCRVETELKQDERLGQAERFEPRLKNMYEDAVLLGGSSNIVLVEEDDDEPIHLG